MTKKSYYPSPEQNFDFPKMEQEILQFWQENKIFEKSVSNRDFSGIENEEDNGMMTGFTENYVKVKTPYNESLANTFQKVQLTEIDRDGLMKCEF